jgi:hypothetical protein
MQSAATRFVIPRNASSAPLLPRSGGEGSGVGGASANSLPEEQAAPPPTPDPSPPRARARGGRGVHRAWLRDLAPTNSRHCERKRSNPWCRKCSKRRLDCFVAYAPRNDGNSSSCPDLIRASINLRKSLPKGMDCRVKPGNDEKAPTAPPADPRNTQSSCDRSWRGSIRAWLRNWRCPRRRARPS